MARKTSTGKCGFCGKSFSKSGISRHLESCRVKTAAKQDAIPLSGGRKAQGFHLAVEGRDAPEYWLRLDAAADVSLLTLDDFLRDAWLECCEHLSAFDIEGVLYFARDRGEFADIDDGDIEITLKQILRPGVKFRHEYDFGTTTELVFRVVSEGEVEVDRQGIRVLARNDPPALVCEGCGAAALWICSECVWSGPGMFCEGCSGSHAAEHTWDGFLLPAVNSPRAGMCGYTGPEDSE